MTPYREIIPLKKLSKIAKKSIDKRSFK